MSTAIVYRPEEPFSLPDNQRRLIRWTIYLGFAALSIGILNGLDQALDYAGIEIFKYYPEMKSYYQGLTVHGVFNAIVLTFAFANGFVAFTMARGLARKLNDALLQASFVTLALGTLLAAYAIVTNQATVLYTFYPPFQAHWTFYLGLVLVVVSTWLTSANLLMMLRGWRREHPGERIPLLAYMSVVTYIFWDLSSIGIAVEVAGLLLPWSLGLIARSDPMLSRTLFWFTGHPIVYFWLLPVYISWYGMIPKQVGGKLFSDSVTRAVFAMFLIIIPVGFHHQYADPGVSPGLKYAIAILTFCIFVPSLITAFSVMYALEIGGRRNGGTGLIGWFFKIPWKDPSVCAQVLAMLAFLLGGLSGVMNASYTMNLVIHNTAFITGHFHLTVGAAVALSYMGITYWLVPYLEQKELWSAPLARFQAWLYFIGVLIFAGGLMSGGLAGLPRRTAVALSPYYPLAGWKLAGVLTGAGGTMMFVAGVLFFVVLVMTIASGKPATITDIPVSETVEAPASSGWPVKLDRLRYLVALGLGLSIVVYGPFLAAHLPPDLIATPFRQF